MRIVFVTNNWIPYSGGVVSSIKSTVEQLRKSGHDVFIITLDFLGKQHTDPDYVIRVPCPIKFRYMSNHMAVPWRPYKYLLQQIQKIMPDIIHVHHPFLLGQSALKVARKLGIPIVFTYHTMYEYYTHYVPLPSMLITPVVKKRVLQFCGSVDGIVVPSSAIQQYLLAHEVKTPLAMIPSALQAHFLQNTFAVKKRREDEPFRLLVVSRFTKEKNIPFLLDVFAKLVAKGADNFALMLVGYGSEFEVIKAHAYETLRLPREQVQFIHKPPRDELVRLYREANLFLFGSQTDTQGLVLAEAMASGTPVVALDGPGQRDIIINGINGFLVQNAEQMMKRVIQIAQDDDLNVLLQENAWKTGQKFEPEILLGRFFDLYQKIV